MKYALIKDTLKIVSIKEVEIDSVNFIINITSTKDEVYTEQYTTSDEVLERLIEINREFNYRNITDWWNSFVQ
jgi:hypothetical protein